MATTKGMQQYLVTARTTAVDVLCCMSDGVDCRWMKLDYGDGETANAALFTVVYM